MWRAWKLESASDRGRANPDEAVGEISQRLGVAASRFGGRLLTVREPRTAGVHLAARQEVADHAPDHQDADEQREKALRVQRALLRAVPRRVLVSGHLVHGYDIGGLALQRRRHLTPAVRVLQFHDDNV